MSSSSRSCPSSSPSASDPQTILRLLGEAESPDHEIDAALSKVLGFDVRRDECCFDYATFDGQFYYSVPQWRFDLNATISLVEERLPGWSWGVAGALGPTAEGMLYERTTRGWKRRVRRAAPTPSLALLSAFFSISDGALGRQDGQLRDANK